MRDRSPHLRGRWLASQRGVPRHYPAGKSPLRGEAGITPQAPAPFPKTPQTPCVASIPCASGADARGWRDLAAATSAAIISAVIAESVQPRWPWPVL